jgi:eukaryotic-like serine/threonine-protein kinase
LEEEMASDKETPAQPLSEHTITIDLGHSTISEVSSGNEESPLELPQSSAEHFSRKGLLGKGGMGAVYCARDHVLQRDIAVKTLFGEVSPRSSYWKRFLREAQITAQLAHPAIVPIHSLEQSEGHPCLVMKLVKGQTLSEYMDSCRAAVESGSTGQGHDLFSRVDKMLRVCEAMAYAHNSGVIHRDLKPQNIMVGEFGEVYVMDWGMARAIGESDEAVEGIGLSVQGGVQTVAGALMGTPQYMAPEQARMEYDAIGPASDQYALGIVLYELATLLRARSGVSVEEIVAKAADAKPLVFGAAPLDPRLEAVIRKATAAQISDRYHSVDSLALDLRRFRRGDAVTALPESLLRRSWRAFARRPVLAMGCVLALVLVAAFSSIWSLWATLDSQRTAARKQEITSSLIGSVSTNALQIDELLGKTHMLLNGITKSTQIKLQLGTPKKEETRCIPPPAIEGLPESRPHSRYNDNLVTLQRAVCLLAPGIAQEDAATGLTLGESIQSELIDALFQGRTMQEMEASFWNKDSPETIQWVYAGTSDGVLINYPGIDFFPESYDPRLRPWYIQGLGNVMPTCEEPYPDASGSGYLLPCTQRLLDASGAVFGVAGIDFSMDSVIDAIQQVDLPHLGDSLLLNGKLGIIASSKEKGERLSSEEAMKGNLGKKIDTLQSDKLREELDRGLPNGLVVSAEETYVYSRLQFAPWTLVYSMDEEVWRGH